MASKFRFFQANFSATLLRSAAIAIALLVQAAPARAQVVTLICQNNNAGSSKEFNSFTLRINYDQKVVELLSPSGTVWFSEAARITESEVQWFRVDSSGFILEGGFSGTLNRLSGEGSTGFPSQSGAFRIQMSGPCRRATQKF